LKDGSVIAVDKAGDYPAAEVPYVLDARSGEYYEAAEERRKPSGRSTSSYRS